METNSTEAGEGELRIRVARLADLEALVAIYNHEVRESASTFDVEPWGAARGGEWFDTHDPERHPILAAERDGKVVGWGSLSRWSDRAAYDRTCEISVFVDAECRGQGVGRALARALVACARAAGHGVLLARIEASNEASIALFRKLGFATVGVMHRVGEKFGRSLDVALLEMGL